jgi:hypothetical protein
MVIDKAGSTWLDRPMPGHHIAQLNVGRLLAPIDDPLIAGFVAGLDPVNAIADAAAGFLWRLQDDSGNATAIRPYQDPTVAVNYSIWETIEDLWNFVYRSRHLEPLRQRRSWFETPREAHTVLFWVPGGERPPLAEALARLDHLRQHGATPQAFTFKQRFPAPALV